MTLCVPRCTYFPLLPLLIEPIRFYIEYNRARLGRQGGKVDKEEEQRRIKTD